MLIRLVQIILAVSFIAEITNICFLYEQSDFSRYIWPFTIAFFSYLFILFNDRINQPLRFWLGTAILVRILLVFSFPNLSDDIYRFIWDGNIWQTGENAYSLLPAEVLGSSEHLNEELFSALNSPEYYTIYPPFAQLIFWFSSLPFWGSWAMSSVVMKLFMLLAEIGSIYFIVKILDQLSIPRSRVLLYALNPLVIIEIMGNLHFEGFMIFFLLLFIYHALRYNMRASSASMALSVGSKLLPLMFLPFMIRLMDRKMLRQFYFRTGLILVLLFIPIILGLTQLGNFGQSLDLYFQKFEFNGGLYYLLRYIGQVLTGYNLIWYIGPGLALIALLLIICLAMQIPRERMDQFPKYALFAFTIYLLTATTVHPWYLCLPIALCLFTRFRFPIVWSGLIFLTYINYSYEVYWENMWVVALEYVLLGGYIGWEIVFKKLK